MLLSSALWRNERFAWEGVLCSHVGEKVSTIFCKNEKSALKKNVYADQPFFR